MGLGDFCAFLSHFVEFCRLLWDFVGFCGILRDFVFVGPGNFCAGSGMFLPVESFNIRIKNAGILDTNKFEIPISN